MTNTVQTGLICQSQTRTCTNGTLSGSFIYAACAVASPLPPQTGLSCTLGATTIADGSNKTFYQNAIAPYGQACVAEVRICTNGALSGSYTNLSCIEQAPASCTAVDGVTLGHNETHLFHASRTVPFGQSCVSETRTCTNGALSGSYTYAACSVSAPLSCAFNNQSVAHGASVTAYQTSSVPYGQTCPALQTRSCTNGTLSGSYAYNSCAPETPAPLTRSWAIGDWGACANSQQTRIVTCKESSDATVPDSLCTATKPATSQQCVQPYSGSAYNAVRIGDQTVVPLYTAPGQQTAKIGFLIGGTSSGISVTTYNQNGGLVWSKILPQSEGINGGFDNNGDGYVDLVLHRKIPRSDTCGSTARHDTWLEFYSGLNGDFLYESEHVPDLCVRDTNSAIPQLGNSAVLFGGTSGFLAYKPYHGGYPEDFARGWIRGRNGDPTYTFIHPSQWEYATLYTNATTHNGSSDRAKENITIPQSHFPNGLLTLLDGIERLVYFTSLRVLQFALAPEGPAQLLFDRPFKTLGEGYWAGRMYGLVQVDPADPSKIAIVAGAPVSGVYYDMKNNSVAHDPTAGGERHAGIYDMRTNTMHDRYYSYAGPGHEHERYENRILYPAHVFLPSSQGSSHLAYNVFRGGRWYLDITAPGTTESIIYAPGDLLLWDITRDDNKTKMIVTPIDVSKDTPVGKYFPQWLTYVLDWNQATARFDLIKSLNGIPYTMAMFREYGVSDSGGYIYPALIGVENGKRGLYLVKSDGVIHFEEL